MNNIFKLRITNDEVLKEIEGFKKATGKPSTKIINEMLEHSLGSNELTSSIRVIKDELKSIENSILDINKRITTITSWSIQNFVYTNVVLESLKLYYKHQNINPEKLLPPNNFGIKNTYMIEKFQLEKVIDYINEIRDGE